MPADEDIPADLPEGLEFDPNDGLKAEGVVARQLAEHRVGPRPGRPFKTCMFDSLGGNTSLGIHLAQLEPDGTKCDHRHLDETMAYVIAGSGYSEYRQDDAKGITRIEWEAGDVLVIPCNAWHKHYNAMEGGQVRQVSFRNTPLINRLLQNAKQVYQSGGATYHQASRFPDRYNDEPDYFTLQEALPDGRIRTNFIKQVADQPLPDPDPRLGHRASLQGYELGGQRTLDVALVGIGAGGYVRPHQPLAEEAMVILRGQGRTEIWQKNGSSDVVEWRAGDLVSPPLHVWRQHTASTDARYLAVRDISLLLAMGAGPGSWFETPIPDRYPDLLEPGD